MFDDRFPLYNTGTFSQIFPTYASFKSCFDNDFGAYAKDCIPEKYLNILYWLLYSRYCNNPTSSYSENVFKSQIVAITWQRGPTWVKKVQVQDSLRSLSEADLITGARTIFNRAVHPENQPGTNTDEELTYLNAQDVSKQRRSKLDAYSYLFDVLKNDVTEEFISAFAKLFSKYVSPTVTRIYENDSEEEE